MSFKVGDRVRINDNAPKGFPHGEVGEIVGEGKVYDYAVQTPSREKWWFCNENEIDLVQLPMPLLPDVRHPNSRRFHELLMLAGDMHDRKQADYGRDDDPFANVRASEEWGMPGWMGAMLRLHDKVRRLQALARTNRLRNESAYDSFMDIAVYALIACVLYEEDSSSP